MKSTLWWGTAHALATILHLVMGVVGIVTFHNTAIQALNDFMSGVTVGSSSIGLMSEASLLQGVIAVGCIGFFFNLTQYMTLLWTEHKISSHNSRSWYFKRKVAVLSGLLVSCGVFIGDIALAAMLGLKNKNVAIGPIAASAVAGSFMALTIVADLVKMYIMDGQDSEEQPLEDTVEGKQQA